MQPQSIEKIGELACCIYNLMSEFRDGWVLLTDVAKACYGSESYAPFISSYARLEEARGLFASTNKAIKLTNEGIKFIEEQPSDPLPPDPLGYESPNRIARAVRQYASRLQNQYLRVKQILTLERAGNKYVHAVHVSIEDGLIATETPVKFLPGDGGTAIGGRVVGQEPDGIVLYVAFESRIHAAQATEARLMIDRSFLLAQLANALDNLPSLPKLAKPLWQVGYVGGGIANTDSVEVANQLAQLNTPWTRFLWGPPGAGKTYGLSYLTRLLLHKEPNNRILLVAPSNLAVDVVMGQVVRQLEASPSLRHLISQRKVMRFGYPRKAQILERPELLGPTNLDDYTQEIRRLSERIAKAEREKASDAQLAILRSKLLEAQETLKQAVDEHVKQCQVVATTTTLAYLPSSPITQVKWDTVVVDEVTMVPPAVCVFLSSLAEQRLLLAGDPRQLGPVYEENYGPVGNDREYMGRDIFEAGKVSLNINGIHHILVNDSRLVRITSQRRSATGIWEKVKHLYPDVESLNNKCQPNVSANYLRFLGSQSSYLM